MKNKSQILFALLLSCSLFIVSCKKDYLETKPSDAVTNAELVKEIASISTIITGTGTALFEYNLSGTNGGHDFFGQKALDLSNDLVGEDMIVHAQGNYRWFNTDYQYIEWTRPQTNRRSDNAWFMYYNLISRVNNVLENVDAAIGGTKEDKETIKGQAYAYRAYCYYFLANYFQQTYKGNESKPGVPIVISKSDASKNKYGRNTLKEVFDQILSDLKAAEINLMNKTITDKTTMNYNVVCGFRARTALLMEDWLVAADYAKKAYGGNYTLMNATEYKSGFSKISNPEWMWGSYIPSDQATIYASFFSHIDITNQGYAYFDAQKKIPKSLYDKIPTGDVRKTLYTITGASNTDPLYNQKKFRVSLRNSWAADYIYMRAGEMYLIEAEAYAKLGQDVAARTALTAIVKPKYPTYSISSLSGQALIDEIYLQRKIELWGEGFSMIDIKRLGKGLHRTTGAGNHGIQNLDPIIYDLPAGHPFFLMRIPQREIDTNILMTEADQNP